MNLLCQIKLMHTVKMIILKRIPVISNFQSFIILRQVSVDFKFKDYLEFIITTKERNV